ncbi:MAG: alpha/beta fold hydrolase [Myxococcales bacterium]|nr:alpha/beta fold hydrolase [Myxococcales bacterium]
MSIFDWLERLARVRLHRAGIGSRTVAGPHGAVHAYDAPGRGPLPPAVLLHGIGSSATAYGGLLAGLLPHVERVVAPDLPGHGFSDPPPAIPAARELADAAVAIVDGFVDEPAIVVGTSLGGALALHYALARPDKVAALVLCSPAGAPPSVDELAELRALFAMESRADAAAFVDRLFAGRPPLRRLIVRAVHDRLRRPIVQAFLGGLDDDAFLTPAEAAALRPPTLLLWGTAEKVLPATALDWFRTHLPSRTRIERPEGWGHSAHLEATAALVERICTFAAAVVEGSEAKSCPPTEGEAPSP